MSVYVRCTCQPRLSAVDGESGDEFCVEDLGGRGWQGQVGVVCARAALLVRAGGRVWCTMHVGIEKGRYLEALRGCGEETRVFAAHESRTLRRPLPSLLASI